MARIPRRKIRERRLLYLNNLVYMDSLVYNICDKYNINRNSLKILIALGIIADEQGVTGPFMPRQIKSLMNSGGRYCAQQCVYYDNIHRLHANGYIEKHIQYHQYNYLNNKVIMLSITGKGLMICEEYKKAIIVSYNECYNPHLFKEKVCPPQSPKKYQFKTIEALQAEEPKPHVNVSPLSNDPNILDEL